VCLIRGRRPIRGESRKSIQLGKVRTVNILLVVIAIVAVVLLITGGMVQSLQFLLWVGIVLLIIAVIMFIMRSISGRKSV